jgi:hypothetical protein
MGRLALRRDELRRLQISDIDLANGLLHVHGKGGKRARVPIAYENVAAMQLARHESVATTQTYLHPTQEDLIARMKQVEW